MIITKCELVVKVQEIVLHMTTEDFEELKDILSIMRGMTGFSKETYESAEALLRQMEVLDMRDRRISDERC